MAGLVPAIRALPPARQQDVDARDKRGHDEVDGPAAVSTVILNVSNKRCLAPRFRSARLRQNRCCFVMAGPWPGHPRLQLARQ